MPIHELEVARVAVEAQVAVEEGQPSISIAHGDGEELGDFQDAPAHLKDPAHLRSFPELQQHCEAVEGGSSLQTYKHEWQSRK